MQIININGQLSPHLGSAGNTVSTSGLGTITSISVNGLNCPITATAANSATFSIPDYIDGDSYPFVGYYHDSETISVGTFSVSDGTNTVTARKRLLPPAGLTWTNLEAGFVTTEGGGILHNFSPAAGANNQIYYDPTKCTVDSKGRYRSHVDTVNTLYHRDSSGVVRVFTVTVDSSDTTPNAFGFNTPALAALGATVTSTNTTISGINAAAAVSVTGGLVSINGGAFVSSGTITNGQTIAVRVTASNSYSTSATATVNIGGVTAQFTATTIADPGPPPDTTPDAISFPANTNCTPNSAQSSAVRTIAGINTASPITAATNCTYSVAGGAATSANGSVSNGQTIQLFAVASGAPGATVNASITIGGQVFTWVITTASAQYSPPPESNSTTFGKLKGIAMPIRTSNAKRDIDQSTPEKDRTLQVGHEKQESYKLLLFIEKNDAATGTVELYAKLITAKSYSLVGSVDLASITEISAVETGGPILSVMAVPVGVTGTFDFSYAGF